MHCNAGHCKNIKITCQCRSNVELPRFLTYEFAKLHKNTHTFVYNMCNSKKKQQVHHAKTYHVRITNRLVSVMITSTICSVQNNLKKSSGEDPAGNWCLGPTFESSNSRTWTLPVWFVQPSFTSGSLSSSDDRSGSDACEASSAVANECSLISLSWLEFIFMIVFVLFCHSV